MVGYVLSKVSKNPPIFGQDLEVTHIAQTDLPDDVCFLSTEKQPL